MLHSERLSIEKETRKDTCISLGRENRIDFVGKFLSGGLKNGGSDGELEERWH